MLVCPHCQFENPDTNRFCQSCGTSLVEQECPECRTIVSFATVHCPTCGTQTGRIWRAILSPVEAASTPSTGLPTTPVATDTVAQMTEASGGSAPFPESSSEPLPEAALPGHYLDVNQRYQLLDPMPEGKLSSDVEVRVLDCLPLQPSALSLLYDDTAATAESADLSEVTATLPAIAQTYLELQQELYPLLPDLHDAWEADGRTVMLLEDRAHLLPLESLWNDGPVPPFQILHLLHQMTELWTVLHPLGFARSVLELSNLKIDEDQLLYLQRLERDSLSSEPQLPDLGQTWTRLFQAQAGRADLTPLLTMSQHLVAGQIATLDELKTQLTAIAEAMQQGSTSVSTIDATEPLATPTDETSDEVMTQPLGPALDDSTADAPLSSICPTVLEQVDDEDDDDGGESDDIPTIVLPMKLINLDDAGRSDIGRQREHNEDYFSIETEVKRQESVDGRTLQVKGLYILCDGMGGHAGGEVASALAVETLRQYFQEHWQQDLPSEEVIRTGVMLANQAIYTLNQQNDRSGSGRMGTTLVLMLVQDTQAAIAHVGDSRLYRFSRRRGLEQLTVDHEVGQREIQRGVEPAIAYARPDAYQLTQALGPRDDSFVNPDVQFIELNEDLLLLLCSDGLTDNNLLDKYAETHLLPLLSFQTNLEQGVNQLIDLANEHNGHDNITAIVVRTKVRPNLELLKRG